MGARAELQPGREVAESFSSVVPRFLQEDFGRAAVASLVIAAIGWTLGLPTALVAAVAVAPLLVPLMRITDWTVSHYGAWVGFFLAFMVMQVAHFGEHIAQIVQIHILGRAAPEAHGIIGELDIEWVHFVWNSIVVAAALALLWRFRSNAWLWVTAFVAVWHLGEHVAIMTVFWDTGIAGDPGLLATGGDLGGGLGLARPELHFLYNVVETAPLVIAYIYSVQHSVDSFISRALPSLGEPDLLRLTAQAEHSRLKVGETRRLRAEPGAACVVARGCLSVSADGGAFKKIRRGGRILASRGAAIELEIRALKTSEVIFLESAAPALEVSVQGRRRPEMALG